MEKVVYSDLYRFHFLSGVAIAPDEAHAVFVKTMASEETNSYCSELWLLKMQDNSLKRLTAGSGDKDAFWLDARTVVFSSKREKQEKQESSTWYQISIDGGEAEKYLELKGKVSGLKPLGGGKFLAVERVGRSEPEDRQDEAKEGRDFYVFDELPFWRDGSGIQNGKRSALILWDEVKQEKTVLTPPDMDVEAVVLSEDRSTVVYAAMEYRDIMPQVSGLYQYDLVSGVTATLVPQKDMRIANPYFMGENLIFFTGTKPEFPGINPRYYLYDRLSGEIRQLPFCDASPSGSVGGDSTYGGGKTMKYIRGKLWFPQLSWGNAQLMCMGSDGIPEAVCTTPGSFQCFDMTQRQVLMTAMRGTNLQELWSLDLETGEETQLTQFNTAYMAGHAVAEPERFVFRNSDGYELEGFVLKPQDYEPGKTYPGILEIHGGPKAVFGSVFHHEMQCFAAMGFFVFYTNPRGSDGRGEAFANITGQLGGIDYQDIMEFTDEVLRRYPELDAARLGVCGGSYGGFMCNWIIGHTDRFAAAASQRSISNYLSKALCTDIGYYHNMAQLGTTIWQDFDTVWANSPLKYAPEAKTPTLFIQADEDYRCWMSDAFQMFTALKQNGVDSRLVLIHGESHGLSRTGKPQNRITRLQEIGSWFVRYLKA